MRLVPPSLLVMLTLALSACVSTGPASQYPAVRATYLQIGARAYPVVSTGELVDAALGGLSDIDPAFTVRKSGKALQLLHGGATLANFTPAEEWPWQQAIEDALVRAFAASAAASRLSNADQQIVIINAMLRRAGRHASYLPSIDGDALRRAENETGFGAAWRREDHRLLIETVQPGSVGALYRIEPGDAITALNGQPVIQLPDALISQVLTGPVRYPIKVTLDRQNPARLRDIYMGLALRRGILVWHEGVVFIRMPTIQPGPRGSSSAIELAHALQKLLAEHESEPLKGVVLDLRGNDGGWLFDAVSIVDLFLPYGPVAVIKRRERAQERIIESTDGFMAFGALRILESVPMVVLVNGETAAGAEIIAAAVQLRQRGIVIGTATMGFPHVHAVMSLRPSGLDGTISVPDGLITLPGAQVMPVTGLAPTLCLYEMGGDQPSRIEFGLARMEAFAGRPRARLTPAEWAQLPYLCPGDAEGGEDDLQIASHIVRDRALYDRILQSVPPNHYARSEDFARPR